MDGRILCRQASLNGIKDPITATASKAAALNAKVRPSSMHPVVHVALTRVQNRGRKVDQPGGQDQPERSSQAAQQQGLAGVLAQQVPAARAQRQPDARLAAVRFVIDQAQVGKVSGGHQQYEHQRGHQQGREKDVELYKWGDSSLAPRRRFQAVVLKLRSVASSSRCARSTVTPGRRRAATSKSAR
jgi:hypothetical protein